jgi:hypothetical protein
MVEVVNRELVRCLKPLRLGFKFPFKSWPTLLPIVQSALNNTVLPHFGNRSSVEVFLGLPTSSPITTAVVTKENKSVILSLEQIRARQLLQVEKLQTTVDVIHREVAGLTSQARNTRVARHNSRTGVRPITFTVGDVCLEAS